MMTVTATKKQRTHKKTTKNMFLTSLVSHDNLIAISTGSKYTRQILTSTYIDKRRLLRRLLITPFSWCLH